MFRQALKISTTRVSRSTICYLRLAQHTLSSRLLIFNPYLPNLKRTFALSTEGERIESQIDQVSVSEYNNISDEYLETLSDSLEDLTEKVALVEYELTEGVLKIYIPENGHYVINKQKPNKQIWLSSPISGPKRYDLINGKWITLRDGTALTELLEEEISTGIAQTFKFEGAEN